MATETLLPTSLEASTNLSGALTAIDEDPDSPDASWMTATDTSASTSARVGFASPSGNPTGTQTFKARVRKVGGSNTPTAQLDLYENGVLVSSGTPVNVTSTSGALISQSFDASLLSDPTGASVEISFLGTANAGGKPSNRSTVELGAINWDTVNYSVSGPTFNDTPSGTATASGSVTESAVRSSTLAGAISASGSGSESFEHSQDVTGQMTASGSVVEAWFVGFDDAVSGGVTAAGSLVELFSASDSPSGTLVAAGSLERSSSYLDVVSAGPTSSGSVTESFSSGGGQGSGQGQVRSGCRHNSLILIFLMSSLSD